MTNEAPLAGNQDERTYSVRSEKSDRKEQRQIRRKTEAQMKKQQEGKMRNFSFWNRTEKGFGNKKVQLSGQIDSHKSGVKTLYKSNLIRKSITQQSR